MRIFKALKEKKNEFRSTQYNFKIGTLLFILFLPKKDKIKKAHEIELKKLLLMLQDEKAI